MGLQGPLWGPSGPTGSYRGPKWAHKVLYGAQVGPQVPKGGPSGPTGSYRGPKWAHRVLYGAQVGPQGPTGGPSGPQLSQLFRRGKKGKKGKKGEKGEKGEKGGKRGKMEHPRGIGALEELGGRLKRGKTFIFEETTRLMNMRLTSYGG